MPTLRRRIRTSRSQISRPSKNTVPGDGSQRRLRALRSVDLPLPLGPMIPTMTPLGISKLSLFRIEAPDSDNLVRFCIRNFACDSSTSSPFSTTNRCSATPSCSANSQKKKKKKSYFFSRKKKLNS